ncbi:MAG: hypothetical protein ACK5LN_08505 [Propioniciclava sp.]
MSHDPQSRAWCALRATTLSALLAFTVLVTPTSAHAETKTEAAAVSDQSTTSNTPAAETATPTQAPGFQRWWESNFPNVPFPGQLTTPSLDTTPSTATITTWWAAYSQLYVEDCIEAKGDLATRKVPVQGAAPLTLNTISGDDVISASEAAAGITMSGTGQPGSNIDVRWSGSESTLTAFAVVETDGTWSVTFTGTPGKGNSHVYVEDFIEANGDVVTRAVLVQV